MSRRVAVLRPEPGNAATCARARAAGLDVTALPLFVVEPLPWIPPDPAEHDALLLTSANSVRHAGAGLSAFARLPVLAVGAATADAARMAGLDVMMAGSHDAAALIADSGARWHRLLHLGGRETTIAAGGIVTRSILVYASVARPVDDAAIAGLAGAVPLLHSARAAATFAALADRAGLDRATMAVAAISDAVAVAAGAGWAAVAIAPAPTDAALIAAAARLAAKLAD